MSVFELNIDSHARWRGAQVFLNSCLIKKNYVCAGEDSNLQALAGATTSR